VSATPSRGSRSSSTSSSASSASAAERRRALRIPLAALGPVGRRRRLGLLLPLVAAAAVVAGLLVGGDDPEPGAAALAPADTALFVRAETGDELWALAERLPSLRRLHDVRPWVGDELALALPAAGGEPLMIAKVADRVGAERYARGLETSDFVDDYLVVGRRGEGPSLADTDGYRRAAELERAPVELYAPAAGVRRLLDEAPEIVRAFGGFADAPQFQGLAARVRTEADGLRLSARVLRTPDAPPPQEFAPALQGRAPATAAAFLQTAGADALVALLERGGLAQTVAAVRTALPDLAGLDLDRDVLAPLATEAAVTLDARGATPVFTLTARSDDPARTRETLARLQEPLAAQLTGDAGAFRSLDDDAFTLPVTPQLAPSYALDENVLIASTHESGLAQRTLARRGLAQELAVRAVSDQAGGRIEALAFADLRQLLALGERTGLSLGPGFRAVRDDIGQVRTAAAVVRREESDSTVELFLEIP
jgi:Protein of unknown function (DUF3352)